MNKIDISKLLQDKANANMGTNNIFNPNGGLYVNQNPFGGFNQNQGLFGHNNQNNEAKKLALK